MIPGTNLRLLAPASGGYVIEGSGLFDGSSGYLKRTMSTPTNNKIFTISMITKLNDDTGTLFFGGTNFSSNFDTLQYSSDMLDFQMYHSSSIVGRIRTTQLLRDPSAYYHIILAVNTSTGISGTNKLRMYINGVEVTDFETDTNPSNDQACFINSAVEHNIGSGLGNYYCPMYCANVTFIDGLQLDPTSFGEVTTDGFWQINDASELTFGNNGFLLEGTNVSSGGFTADRIPTMSSATDPSGVVTSNGDLSNDDNWKAFDKSASTKWASATQNTGFLGYEFSSSKIIKRYTIEARTATGDAMPKNFTFEGYNGSAWDTLDTQTNETFTGGEIRGYDIPNTTAYTKYKIVITAIGFAGEYPTIQEMTMHEHEDWVVNGIAFGKTGIITATDDSPTDGGADDEYGNYATLDPLNQCKNTAAATISNGNLTFGSTSTSTVDSIGSTLLIPETGEWYWEVTYHNPDANYPMVGISNHLNARSYNDYIPGRAIDPGDGVSLYAGGLISYGSNNTKQAYQSPNYTSNGTVVAFHWNSSTGVLKSSNDGSSYTTMRTLTGDGPWMVYIGSGDTNEGTINFGASDFAYTQVSGTATLQTANLPEPAVANYEDEYYIEAGISHTNGSTTAVTLPWNTSTYETMVTVKRTDSTGSWYRVDTLRGGTKAAQMEGAAPDITNSDGGFSGTSFVITSDYATGTYLLEATKYGLVSATAANEEGSINTLKTTSNNDSKAFMLTWTGTASNGTLGHGLDVAPDFIVACDTDTSSGCDRFVFHKDVPSAGRLFLDTTAAADTNANGWQNTPPSTTLVSVGTGSLNGTGTSVMWGYASSSVFDFGSYEGNNAADGPMVNLGGHDQLVFRKLIDDSGGWTTQSSLFETNGNPVVAYMMLSDTRAVVDGADGMDFISTGFKVRSADTGANPTSTVVYGAFGIQPIQGNGKDTSQGRAR